MLKKANTIDTILNNNPIISFIFASSAVAMAVRSVYSVILSDFGEKQLFLEAVPI